MTTADSSPVVDPAVVDLTRLAGWLTDRGLGSGPIEDVTLLGGGTQNVLLRFRRDGRDYVLRRPPAHKRANSDDTMLREARVLAALGRSRVPHPRFIVCCEDLTVIGAAFYLMAPVDGFNPTVEIPEPFAARPAWQRELGFAVVDALAALSEVDPASVGLGDLGRPDGWLERQVPRWRRQLDGYSRLAGYHGGELPQVDDVGRWLVAKQPSSRGWRPGLIHGDFHLANVILNWTEPSVAAVVDWELTSQGDPLLDLGQLLATWPRSEHPAVLAPAVPLPDLPTDFELLARYERHADRDLTDVTWFRVLACYRLAIVIEGTYARALAGKADSESGELSHQRARALLEQAANLIGSR